MTFNIHIQYDSGPNPALIFESLSASDEKWAQAGLNRWWYDGEVRITYEAVELEENLDHTLSIQTHEILDVRKIISVLFQEMTTLSVESEDIFSTIVVSNDPEMLAALKETDILIVEFSEFMTMSERAVYLALEKSAEIPADSTMIHMKDRKRDVWLFSELETRGIGGERFKLLAVGAEVSAKMIIEDFLEVERYENEDGYLEYENELSGSSMYIENFSLKEGNAVVMSIDLNRFSGGTEDQFVNFIGSKWKEYSSAKLFLEMDNDGEDDTFPVWEIVEKRGEFVKGRLTTLTVEDD